MNKVKFNIHNVHYALKNDDGTYSAPVHVPGAVSVTADPVGDLARFYYNGEEYHVSRNNKGYEGTLEMALLPDSFRVDILREVSDVYDAMIEHSIVSVPHFALGFQVDGDKAGGFYWFYNCVAERTEEGCETNTNSKEPVPEVLQWSCSPDATGIVRAKSTNTTADVWFSEVYSSIAEILITKSGTIITTRAALEREAESIVVTLEPFQDYNGYDRPWAGGNGRNINIYPYYETESGATITKNGITFTDNGDGTITASGISTAFTVYSCHSRAQTDINNLVLPNGIYRISGCPDVNPANPSNNNYIARIAIGRTLNSAWRGYGEDYGKGGGVIFALGGDDYSATQVDLGIQLQVAANKTISDVIYTPLIEKSKAPYPYSDATKTTNGITFTDNGDGTITANGTATGNAYFHCAYRGSTPVSAGEYWLSGCPSGGASNTYRVRAYNYINSTTIQLGDDIGAGVNITVPEDANIGVQIAIQGGTSVNNITFTPALFPVNTDWSPYANICPIEGYTECNLMRTGKNMLQYPYAILRPSSSRTDNGITFTDNGDGTVTANGTATAQASTPLFNNSSRSRLFKAGTYTVSCGIDNKDTYIHVYIVNEDKGVPWGAFVNTSGGVQTFTLEEDVYLGVYLRVKSGVTYDGKKIYPMIREASITDDAWEAYQGGVLWDTTLSEVCYGCTYDRTNGVWLWTHALVKGSSLTWSKQSGHDYIFQCTPSQAIKQDGTKQNILSSQYKTVYEGTSTPNDGEVMRSAGRIVVADQRTSNLDEFRVNVADIEFCYELAAPREVTITSRTDEMFSPYNTIWTDADKGTVTVQFWSSKDESED